MKFIDIENWNRKEHYEFFLNFDNPFWGIVTEIDCTKAYEISKKNNFSFFAYYLHKSILAVNKINEFKYRIQDDKVVMFDTIHVGSTIGRKDGTFGFSFVPFSTDFEVFNAGLLEEIRNVENSTGLRANENTGRSDVIHYSTLPWRKFSSLTHVRNFENNECVPKITFGKFFEQNGKKLIPVSIDIHHSLADGLHVANYLEEFQTLMNE
ncbi:MAG: chloramphenicol acetyltransferase [Calditrichaeota bacterium]|nr:MAG: chloramphenicol acetyltransferase [Calditrichota bacterium]